MSWFGIYLVKVSISLAVFYGLYAVLLRRLTLHQFNRFYLACGMILAFTIPLVNLSLLRNQYPTGLFYSIGQSLYEGEAGQTVLPAEASASGVSLYAIISAIYWTGVGVGLLRIVLSIWKIARFSSRIMNWNGREKVYKTGWGQPFSFLNLIFIPERPINPMILDHEMVHVNQRHWIDLMIVEAGSVLLWFNPVIILYKRAIKLEHEYLADEKVLRANPITEYLECLLNQVSLENGLGPVSQFYSTSIKKRIMMMTSKKTPMRFGVVYLVVFPLVLILLAGFANQPSMENSPVNMGSIEQDNVPAITPVEISKANIASGFGNRIHPILNKEMFHTGIDFRLAEGNLVLATAAGVVVQSRTDSIRGNFVVVKHSEVYVTSYSHLKNMIVKTGEELKAGQTIGYVGSTGLSTAPHLHYEVIKSGKPVDPKDYF